MKRLKRILGPILCIVFISVIGVVDTYAEEETYRAKNLTEFRHVVYKQMLIRDNKIIIEYSGSDYKEIFQSFKNEEFLEYIGTIDDKKTSDDFDYLVHNISYIKTGMKYGSSTKALFTIDIQWRESLQELQFVNTRVKDIIEAKRIRNIDSVYERVKILHDYIATTVEYDTKLVNENAFCALQKGSSTCQGYSLLFYKLLVEAGIECRYITGTGISSKDTGPHGWNIVKIGDLWYNVDVTWDDPVYLDPRSKSNEVNYDYFLKGTTGFDDSHKRDDKFKTAKFETTHPMSKYEFNRRNDVKISEMEEAVGTTLEPVVIEDEPDGFIDKLDNTLVDLFNGRINLPDNIPKYLVASFKELNAKYKTIIILLLLMIVVGTIKKMTKNDDTEEYYEDYQGENLGKDALVNQKVSSSDSDFHIDNQKE